MPNYSLIDARLYRERYIDLFRQYCDELLQSDSSLSQYSFSALAEENLQSDSDHPYLIESNGETAGLVVFMDENSPQDNSSCYSYIGELFVLEQYRRHGIASHIVADYLASQKHDVGLCYVRGSAAERFWLNQVKTLGYAYEVFIEDEVRDFLHISVLATDLRK